MAWGMYNENLYGGENNSEERSDSVDLEEEEDPPMKYLVAWWLEFVGTSEGS